MYTQVCFKNVQRVENNKRIYIYIYIYENKKSVNMENWQLAMSQLIEMI